VGQPPRTNLGKLNERSGQARTGTIEKQPHAQCFSALHCDQSHLPADVIDIREVINESLIGFRITLEPRYPVLNTLAKSRADFKAFLGDAVENHRVLLGQIESGRNFSEESSQVFLSCADVIEDK
jgi:hypothetical protein